MTPLKNQIWKYIEIGYDFMFFYIFFQNNCLLLDFVVLPG